ncbi:MAG: FAD binding domain-containing protein [Sphaerochaetaceae bacterium]|mgnify:CR=1 FL=1|nr:FAD binding domain-containing protein [Sphaerochaetaceae bacterium]
MSEGLRSPNIFTPKSLNEAVDIKLKNPDANFWAGGTHLMSRHGFYPNPEQKDIISLSGITDLFRVFHADRYLEIGAMVNIQQILNLGRYNLSKELYEAVSLIKSAVIRNQATIGGLLSTKDTRYSLSCFLATIGAQVELRMVTRNTNYHWVSVSKLYDRRGNFLFADNAIITRIRIPAHDEKFQLFKVIGKPQTTPETAVFFGMEYSINQGNISSATMAIVFPISCFFMSQEFDNLLSTIALPITPDRIYKISKRLEDELTVAAPKAEPLQIERAKRMLEATLQKINSNFLEG